MKSIEFHNVCKKRKDFAIENLNITIPAGYVTGLIGTNGSGKTTILNMLIGIVQPQRGSIDPFGAPNAAHLKQHIGFVHDNLYMYEQFTIKQMKSFIAPLYDNWNEDMFHYYLTLFDLPLKRQLKTFSKGMAMKCNLLFALSHDPKLLIMDEPTSGLDPVFRRELLDILQALMLEKERTIVLSSHITSDLDRLADHIIFLNQGEVLLQTGMDDFNETFYVIKGSSDIVDTDTQALFLGLDMTDVGFTALFKGDLSVFSDLEDEMLVEKATLEDMMYFMTKKRVHGGDDYDVARQARSGAQ